MADSQGQLGRGVRCSIGPACMDTETGGICPGTPELGRPGGLAYPRPQTPDPRVQAGSDPLALPLEPLPLPFAALSFPCTFSFIYLHCFTQCSSSLPIELCEDRESSGKFLAVHPPEKSQTHVSCCLNLTTAPGVGVLLP